MKKIAIARMILVGSILAFSLVLVGSAMPALSQPLPNLISMHTGPTGGVANIVGVALAELITNHTPMRCIASAAGGYTLVFPLLERGETELGATPNNFELSLAYLGLGPFEKVTKGKGYRNLRLLQVGAPFAVGWLAAKDSGIKVTSDAKGKRVTLGYGAHYALQANTLAYLANAGLTEADIVAVPVSDHTEGVRALIEGRANLAGTAVGAAQAQEAAASPIKAQFVPIDPSPEAVKRMVDVFKGAFAYWQEPGLPGVPIRIPLLGYHINLVTNKSVSDDVIYTIAKCIWDYNDKLTPKHPKFKEWTRENMASTHATIPYHPGAIKFYKEKGVWIKEMEELQRKLLAQ